MQWVGMFPGQGSQEIGMGDELLQKYENLLLDTFQESLGWSLEAIINSKDPELIKKTNIAQPYIFSVSYCYGIEAIKNLGNPTALIGHSLGEYTALCLSGYLEFKDALKVIAVRGEEMQKAVENSNTTMAAVLTNDLEITIEEINKLNNQGIQIWISNFNDPSQVVISSYTDDMDFLKSNPKALGAKRVIPLEVAGAFHTEIVSPAKKPLKDALSEINISEGKIPVYMNVDGKKVEVSSLKDNLVNQIDNSVLFNLQINNVNKDVNPDLWCHIGPGNVTAGMLRKSISYKDLKIINSLESSK
jgi:[acyl-carrier-protein] S-malonyltransferase|tara:strand:+ start:2063 stop:2968 length:906 start_codon:yes stop_codon:yes gene_type:complete